MKKILNMLFFIFGIVLIGYVWRESPPFPVPPPDALQSEEPADSETDLRRAYFTNYTRDQVIEHYKAHFERPYMVNLNYPPEDAQTLIRDQTRSYYLEELVHPMRESLYINGFVAQNPKDDIWIGGRHWEQKITVRYIPSARYWRVIVASLTVIIFYIVTVEWFKETRIIK